MFRVFSGYFQSMFVVCFNSSSSASSVSVLGNFSFHLKTTSNDKVFKCSDIEKGPGFSILDTSFDINMRSDV